MEDGFRPRKKLKIAEPAIVSLLVWGVYVWVFGGIVDSNGHARARQGTASHMISQLDQAIESYAADYGGYPPGDGSGSRELVKALEKVGPKKMKYFEFQQGLLNGGNVVNPVWADAEGPKSIIHYRWPGLKRGSRFDLWAEDSAGDPEGINHW